MKIAFIEGKASGVTEKVNEWKRELSAGKYADAETDTFRCCGAGGRKEAERLLSFDPDITFSYNFDALELKMTGDDYFINLLYGMSVYLLEDENADFDKLNKRLNVKNIFYTEKECILKSVKGLRFAPDIRLTGKFSVDEVIDELLQVLIKD